MTNNESAVREPVEKPTSWLVGMVVLGLLWGAAATAAIYFAFDGRFHILTPLAGVFAGTSLFCGLVGYRPGHYRLAGSDHEMTLWTEFTAAQRIGACGLALLAGVGGPLLSLAA